MKHNSLIFLALAAFLVGQSAAAEIRYVVPTNTFAEPPFTNWYTAATNIQAAVDVATNGDLVLLTNGTYVLTNEVLVNSLITIQGLNGPTVTVVNANYPARTNRAFYLNYRNSGVQGLTIKNGYCLTNSGAARGGGVYGTTNNFIRNCIVVSNRATRDGGGAYLGMGGLVEDCTFFANRADGYSGGGGALYMSRTGTVRRALIYSNVCFTSGGGIYAYQGKIENCIIRSNVASWNGGGIHIAVGGYIRESVVEYNGCNNGGGGILCDNGPSVLNCLIVGNYIGADFGGGVYIHNLGYVINCTIVSNRTSTGGAGGGVYTDGAACYLQNSIVYYNFSGTGSNYAGGGWVENCCTMPTNGTGGDCITNEPAFVNLDGKDFHLTTTSACVNAGYNFWAPGTNDLDGSARIRGGIVDIGCYEQIWDSNNDGIPDWWCDKFGLDPTNPATTHADGDDDKADNLDEWNADTIPTDSNSCLQFLTFIQSGAAVAATFKGGTQAWLFIEESYDLLGTNWSPLTSYPAPPTDVTNSFGVGAGLPMQFFRVRAYR